MNPKIIELIIEDGDQEAGLDGIALVEHPAHEASFEYFNSQEKYHVLSDEEVPQVVQMFNSYGEPQGFLEQEGWAIVEIKPLNRQEFQILADPNAPSSQDTPNVRFRYKYVGPQDSKNRTFCAEMMRANRVFRIEDIIEMSNRSVNPVGPDGYDVFEWRGSYNCRHKWMQLVYKPEGTIINKGSVRKGLIDEDGMPGPDTRTTSTINAGNTPPRTGFAEQGLEDACWPGYEAIGTKIKDGREVPNCVPIKDEMSEDGTYVIGDFASYTDYPELISNNAKKALDYIEKTGNPKGCMTQVGKVRAQQLAQKKPISIETVKRMKNYITRHQKDLQASKSYDDGCGLLAMDAWGGVEALPWVERTIEQYETMSKPVEMSFAVINEEKQIVIGPAMIPNKLIIRRNDFTGEIYYVYFSEDTIKKLQEKFMRDKLLDATNIEHQNKMLDDVDVIESWIVEDVKKDKQAIFNMEYPVGSWMITMKVNNPEVWKQVKDKKLNGFSVQGYFLEKAKFSSNDGKILSEIKEILKNIDNDL